jgi:3-oxoacyl-[acyl-carrier-protein] synthase II
MSARRRVVVTGMGLVSPLGVGVEKAWARLIAGQSGIRKLNEIVAGDVPSKVGGVVPEPSQDGEAGFAPDKVISFKDQKKMDRFIQFALVAAQEALSQAKWTPTNDNERVRTATIIASGIGGFHSIKEAVETVASRGSRRLSPFTVPSFLANLAAGWVSIRHGLKGPLGAPVTACAASVQAIGDAARIIRNNEADVAVCGGAEACIDRVSLGGFAAARALSTSFNDRPEEASRPFDQGRDGFVMGEGAGILVLEAEELAKARGAPVIAEVVGYGTTADAFHLTSGPEDGEGAQRAMRLALADAKLSPDMIDHINAHSTSTPVGDRGELAAIKAVFGKCASAAISATKSATGHLLGAAGGVEAIFSVMSIVSGVMPPTLNLVNPDTMAEGLRLIGPEAEKASVSRVLSNGFGFGGVNASVIFSKFA